MQHKVKIYSNSLQIGMYVCELDRPWLESPFLFQGFVLATKEDIEAVQEVCEYVFVDPVKTKQGRGDNLRRPVKQPAFAGNAPQKRAAVEQEIAKARTAHKHTSSLVKSFMNNIYIGLGVDIQLAKEAVSECVDSVIGNPDAMLLLTQLKNRDEYTSQHSMNVCVLSIAFGRSLGMPVDELQNLGFSGLMHDMGKIRVPLEVLNKPGELTDDEFSLMKSHTVYGRNILMNSSGVLPGAIDVAYSHHESMDGSGYPRAFHGGQLSQFSRMVAIADAYDAITSDRVYQNGRTHMDAINVFHQTAGKKFDSALVFKFIECIGIYPPGTVVEMSNGEVALVIETNPTQKLRPRVMTLLDCEKNPQRNRIVDLSKFELDGNEQPYKIRAVLRQDAHGLDIRQHLDQLVLAEA